MIGFSLEYDGKYYHSTQIKKVLTQARVENEISTTIEIYSLDCLRLIRTHKLYECGAEYSLLEIENVSDDNSKQITRIWDLDHVFTNDTSLFRGGRGFWGDDSTTQIHITTGCNNRFDEFRPYHEPIGPKGNYYQNAGGRSSAGLLPFFELRNEKAQVATMLGIGWSSQWQVYFNKNEKGNNRICAGIPDLNFYLKSDEKIRTASVLVYDYIGERDEAHNIWRRLLKNHFALEKKYGGSMNSYASWGGQADSILIEMAKKFKDAGFSFDCAHFDAGWYGKCPVPTSYVWDEGTEHSGLWAKFVGDWYFNEILHPTHLKEAVEEYKTLAPNISFWFEFERAYKDSDTVRAHPEYYFKTPIGDNYLVNLGSPEGFEYVWNSITVPMREIGANVVGMDFNVDPLSAFNGDDEQDRRGISQIKYVMGLYALFDKYNREYPNGIITNCASGGRRMDIEMMQRTLESHRSDTHCSYDFPCNNTQSHGAVLSYWLPYTTTSLTADANNLYRFRSSYASGIGISDLGSNYRDGDFAKAKANFDEYQSLKKYADKDFYPVFGFSRETGCWGGWQYHDSENDEGFLMAFRREESLSDTVKIKLKGLKNDKIYTFINVDSGTSWETTGENAMKAFTITIENQKESRLIRYKIKAGI
jgi:alpha-galactosidase